MADLFERIEIDQIASHFSRHGFAVVEDIAGPDCVRTLRDVYDGMVDGTIPCPGTDRKLGGLTRQIMMPHFHHPAFLESEGFRNAELIAARLLETESPYFAYSMLIYKPPGHPHITPWHCDLSYAGKPQTPAGATALNNSAVQFWLALNDVDEDMGCMEFIPGVQDNPMPKHFVYSGDPNDEGRLLAMTDPENQLDLTTRVKCPVRAGSATIHGYTTPHFTDINQSGTRGRRAFILTFVNPETFKLPEGERKLSAKKLDLETYKAAIEQF